MKNNQITLEQKAAADVLVYVAEHKSGHPQTIAYSTTAWSILAKLQADFDMLVARGEQGVCLMSFDELDAVNAVEYGLIYNKDKATVIDAELFHDRLNVLPPCNWINDSEFEVFRVSEAISHDLYSFYVRLGRGQSAKYFEVNASRSAGPSFLFNICQQASQQAA